MGLAMPFAYGLNAGDKCGRNRAHAGNHDSQLAFGWLDFAAAIS